MSKENEVASYSFLDNTLTINGPNGSFTIGGPDTGSADEGFDIDFVEDADTMTPGADGSTMHSLNATKRAGWTLRLLKTSPVNAQLANMYNADRSAGSQQWGQNTLTMTNAVSGDSYTGAQTAFRKFPRNAYAKNANMLEWTFNSGQTDPQLGSLTVQ